MRVNAAELANRIPIRHFVDHGPYMVELQPNRVAPYLSYQPVRERAHTIVPKPGDKIPLQVLTCKSCPLRATFLPKPMVGGRVAGAPNPLCETPS